MSHPPAGVPQICAGVGLPGAPSPRAVYAMILALVVGNALIYVFLLHVLYAILLTTLGRLEGMKRSKTPVTAGRPPPWLYKLILT